MKKAYVICLLVFVLALSLVVGTALKKPLPPHSPCLAIVTMMKDAPDIDHWISWHKAKGVEKFYIRLEDAPGVLTQRLEAMPEVRLQIGSSTDAPDRSKLNPVAEEDKSNYPSFLSQMARQRVWVQEAIQLAALDGVEWIIHLDSDELLDCKGMVQDYLTPENINGYYTLYIPNKEAKYKKPNTDSCFTNVAEWVDCEETPNLCTAYVNGKPIGRVSRQLQERNVHLFYHPDDKDKPFRKLKGVHVLHFESCNLSKYLRKFEKHADPNKHEAGQYPFDFYNKSAEVAHQCALNNSNRADCLQKMTSLYRQYKITNTHQL